MEIFVFQEDSEGKASRGCLNLRRSIEIPLPDARGSVSRFDPSPWPFCLRP